MMPDIDIQISPRSRVAEARVRLQTLQTVDVDTSTSSDEVASVVQPEVAADGEPLLLIGLAPRPGQAPARRALRRALRAPVLHPAVRTRPALRAEPLELTMRAADAGHAAVSALAVGARVARRAAVLPLPMRTPLPHVTTTAGPSPVLAPAVECGATREASWLLRRSKNRFVSRDRGFQKVFMCTLRFGIGSGVTKNFHLASRDEPCLGGLNSVNGSRRRKNTFRGVFSERAARREPQARRAPERAVLETPARLRPFRARRRHAPARPSRSARRSSENRSPPVGGRRFPG